VKSVENNFVQHELGWVCSNIYFEKEKKKEIYLTKIYSEVLWRITHLHGLYNFRVHTTYGGFDGSVCYGDIICESSTFTDKNGDIWINHHRGWSMLYHAESKTYYMKKVNIIKSQEKSEEESKQLFSDIPESALLKIFENNDLGLDDKKEFF